MRQTWRILLAEVETIPSQAQKPSEAYFGGERVEKGG